MAAKALHRTVEAFLRISTSSTRMAPRFTSRKAPRPSRLRNLPLAGPDDDVVMGRSSPTSLWFMGLTSISRCALVRRTIAHPASPHASPAAPSRRDDDPAGRRRNLCQHGPDHSVRAVGTKPPRATSRPRNVTSRLTNQHQCRRLLTPIAAQAAVTSSLLGQRRCGSAGAWAISPWDERGPWSRHVRVGADRTSTATARAFGRRSPARDPRSG